jgi:hypothetical protein
VSKEDVATTLRGIKNQAKIAWQDIINGDLDNARVGLIHIENFVNSIRNQLGLPDEEEI